MNHRTPTIVTDRAERPAGIEFKAKFATRSRVTQGTSSGWTLHGHEELLLLVYAMGGQPARRDGEACLNLSAITWLHRL